MASYSILWTLICSYLVVIQGEKKLKLVQTVFRHGDRSPVGGFPTDEHADFWPQGMGQLTKVGMQQHYELGTYIRQRYALNTTFLSHNYSRAEVHVRSTDVDRTLMSAQSHLAGLFPPADKDRFREDVAWQPIPVHTVNDADDHLLNPDAPCPKADKQFAAFLNSTSVQQEETENKVFYDFVEDSTGVKHENLSDVWMIRDTLFCEKQHNLSMPAWLNNTIWQKLDRLSALEFDSRYGTKDQGRLRGGPLVREMLANMEMKINGSIQPAERSFFIYSGHDTTVSAFLGALRLFNNIMPPYASAVLVELWQDDITNQSFVQILYKNDTDATPLVLTGCETFCPWEQFVNLTSDMVPGADWEKECTLPDHHSFWTQRNIIAMSVGAGVLLLCLLVTVVFVVKRRRRRDDGYAINYGLQHDDEA